MKLENKKNESTEDWSIDTITKWENGRQKRNYDNNQRHLEQLAAALIKQLQAIFIETEMKKEKFTRGDLLRRKDAIGRFEVEKKHFFVHRNENATF